LAQIKAGAEVIQLFESWAGSLDAESFPVWSIAPTQRIVSAIKSRHPEIPVIGFPRGAGVRIASYAEGTGIDGVGLDWSVPLDWASTALKPALTRQGNLDPMALIAGGAALYRRTEAILTQMHGQRFIFNLGHGILPETPLEHVAALVEQIRKAPV